MSLSVKAADILPMDADELACHNADNSEAHSGLVNGGDEDLPDHDHDHHAHNCGTCHTHIFATKVSNASLLSHESLFLRPTTDLSLAPLGPQGLYRPPRA